MVNFNDSIDTTIFVALQISRTCLDKLGRQTVVYLSSNPGCGKSSAVMEYCKIHGYHLELLRISNETPDTITGYDIAANTNDTTITSAKHIRPSWFERILDNDKKGISSVLFLDELCSADVFTQAAALNICFERRVGAHEFLPPTCLVVAAGNYADNLSSEFSLIGPMLNRFMVVNIQPSAKDLKHFLCKYQGAAIGQRVNLHNELESVIKKLEEQGNTNISDDMIGKIGEILEQSIRTEAEVQIKEGISNLGITELKDIYSSTEDNEGVGLPGFVTFRSLNYLVDASVACYMNFGKAGLLSDNFRKIIHGTVGLALSRDKDGTLKKTVVTERYYAAIANAANDIERMNNDKLPEYQSFFNTVVDVTNDKAEISAADMGLITKKIQDMLKDKDIAKIDRPVEPKMVEMLVKGLINTLKKNRYQDASFDQGDKIRECVLSDPDKYINYVVTWNTAADLLTEINGLVKDQKKKYPKDTKEVMNKAVQDCREYVYNLKMIMKIIKRNDKTLADIVPEIKQFS
jgi:MoxR-like ATPase